MKTNSKQQYLISAYLLPAVIEIVAIVAIWYASAKYKFSNVDLAFGYLSIITTAFVFSQVNKLNWLPLPDGAYVHKDDLEKPPITAIEPAIYQHLFYTSTSSKISSVILGLLLTGAGSYIFRGGYFFLPSLTLIGGIFLVYSGYRELIDKSPKLKLAKEGLWTKQLGFKPWSTIKRIELKVNKGTYLEIYLKNGSSDVPDLNLLISDLVDYWNIQPLIKSLFRS